MWMMESAFLIPHVITSNYCNLNVSSFGNWDIFLEDWSLQRFDNYILIPWPLWVIWCFPTPDQFYNSALLQGALVFESENGA